MPEQAQDSVESSPIPREQQFVHLHLHSEYSLLDGGNRMDRLVDRVAELGMDAVAVTDHGNLFGALQFVKLATKKGIKPILGCEAYVAPASRLDRKPTGVADGGFHLVLLCENNAGWANLMKLASDAYLEGFYYKPRIDRELLEAHSEGLIAINGHLGSELAYHLVRYENSRDESHWDSAMEVAQWHKKVFAPTAAGPRFYIELQHHIPDQNAINPHLIRLAKELDLPVVATNDAHFLRAEDHDAHDTLICISMGKVKSDPNRLHYTPELYVKTPQQMRELFEGAYADIGKEACDNTLAIADRCNVSMEFENHAPVVRIVCSDEPLPFKKNADLSAWHKTFCARYEVQPVESTGDQSSFEELKAQCDRALRELCEAGLIWRYGPSYAPGAPEPTDERERQRHHDIRARLDRELGVLIEKTITPYFLIVWDFVNWGRQQGIPANARGSGVGTMVGYLLGLSNACPVRYGLLFERFTDPDRSEYPDIDIDLCQDGRAEVIDYVREKYGHVAQIITFGTLKARAGIRDCARVLEVSLPVADRLAKMIPDQLGITLDESLEQEPDFRAAFHGDAKALEKLNTGLPPEQYVDASRLHQLVNHARTVEGQARHASVHAAGVIVATRPLHEIVPLYKQPSADDIITQWDGPTCERIGLLKMDFLGLRTLSIIERCRQLIKETLPDEAICAALGWEADRVGDPLDLERLTFDDAEVFALFQRADTTGVFQFESGGMRRLLAEMKPDRLEDLIAANALFRPGPMDLIPDYNRRKHGQESVPKVHPIVDRHTAETYGVMVYQEQVMQIVHELGGVRLRDAYTLIKAISKKKKKVIDANRSVFIENAQKEGLSEKKAEDLFDLILKFAGYGFNKSHSTGYAIVAYQTAFLKTFFPNHYMAALLTYESQAQKIADWATYLDDCKRVIRPDGGVGVEVRPPDINLSARDFAAVYEDDEERTASSGHVRFGLRAIKGVATKAIDAIVIERSEHGPFSSLFEFCERVPQGVVNKATIESLIKCGAFDSLHGSGNRASMVATVEPAVSAGASAARDRAAGQSSLFGGSDESGDAAPPPTPALVKAEPWSSAQTLTSEKEAMGMYVSSHPIDAWSEHVASLGAVPSVAVKDCTQDKSIVLVGLIQSIRVIVTRHGKNPGQKMGIVTVEDKQGAVECVFFPDSFAAHEAVLEPERVLAFVGRVDQSRGDTQVIADRAIPIDEAPTKLAKAIEIRIDDSLLNGSTLQTLTTVSDRLRTFARADRSAGGKAVPVIVELKIEDRCIRLEAGRELRVRPTERLLAGISDTLGAERVRLLAGPPKRSADSKRRNYQRSNQKR